MASSGMLRRVALVRTDVSKELNASFIRVTRIGELGTTLAVTRNRRTLQRNTFLGKFNLTAIATRALSNKGAIICTSCLHTVYVLVVVLRMSSVSSLRTGMYGLTRATPRNIPEDTILHSHHHENIKSYITYVALTVAPIKWQYNKHSWKDKLYLLQRNFTIEKVIRLNMHFIFTKTTALFTYNIAHPC
jgi:hypothetical protein